MFFISSGNSYFEAPPPLPYPQNYLNSKCFANDTNFDIGTYISQKKSVMQIPIDTSFFIVSIVELIACYQGQLNKDIFPDFSE